MRHHKGLLVFGLGIYRRNVVSVCIVDQLAGIEQKGKCMNMLHRNITLFGLRVFQVEDRK